MLNSSVVEHLPSRHVCTVCGFPGNTGELCKTPTCRSQGVHVLPPDPVVDQLKGVVDARFGTKVGRFILGKRLGSGGCGSVYAGYRCDGQSLLRAAIKLLREFTGKNDLAVLKKFWQEAKILSQLQCDNIIAAVGEDVEIADNMGQYIAMELFPGLSLREWMASHHARYGSIPLFLLRSIMTQMGQALTYAHANGVIHRDIKPENILVMSDANHVMVKLVDFGLAKITELGSTTTNVCGTRPYMAPETLYGKCYTSSDIYSLGVVLMEWFTTFRKDGIDVVMRRAAASPRLGLSRVFSRSVCPPEQRYESVRGFQLEACAAIDELQSMGFTTCGDQVYESACNQLESRSRYDVVHVEKDGVVWSEPVVASTTLWNLVEILKSRPAAGVKGGKYGETWVLEDANGRALVDSQGGEDSEFEKTIPDLQVELNRLGLVDGSRIRIKLKS